MILIWTISIANIFSKNKNKIKAELEMEEKYKNSLICRFVLDGLGRKIGESVAFNDDLLIIKSGKKYLGVPIKHIEEEGKTLLVKGLVEQDKAELMGEKWRRESFKEINNCEDEKHGL
jgi:hypothetical protein